MIFVIYRRLEFVLRFEKGVKLLNFSTPAVVSPAPDVDGGVLQHNLSINESSWAPSPDFFSWRVPQETSFIFA